ncbi:MAG: ABC-F type ribosomal protection protein [Erysipelotrichaceae bacterium]|nr:ABC-F type ribosomal protection protein [Erysipelotrichaceae bacterium]
MLLQISSGKKEFGDKVLFDNLNFEIKGKEKVALIGRNGCGKSTLLKIICKQMELDKGSVFYGPKVTVGYLAQQAFSDESITVREEFDKVYEEVISLEERMQILSRQMETEYSDEIFQQYSEVQQRFEDLDGYNYNQQQLTLFTKFGFSFEDLERPLSTFSGGQKTRIAFVKLLLSKPDILLLDEPTNHLDMETIIWLEDYLKKYPKAIVLVSHDRMFLDNIVSEVYEFEFGRLNHYAGNYSRYVELKKQDFEKQQAAYVRQQQEIQRLEQLIEKFRYKKNKAAFAQSKITYLKKMERIEKPREDKKNFKVDFRSSVKGGSTVLETDKLVIGYERPLCTITLQLMKQQRMAVIGPNGLGKSTFVKTLMGLVEPLGGDYMFGHQIEAAYFDQTLAQINSEKTVLDELWDEYPEYDHTEIRKILGQFLFSADDVYKTCNVLSGGEKVRLTLAKIMLAKANLLILDEPTNHLDIPGKEALEDALLNYDGTVIFVSHDRYFIQKLATCILNVENERTAFYPLNYDDYMERREKLSIQSTSASVSASESSSKIKRENSKKLASLERQISAVEQKIAEREELYNTEQYASDYKKLQDLQQEIAELNEKLADLLQQWEDCHAGT